MQRRTLTYLVGCLALLLVVQMAVAADLNGKWNFVFANSDGEYPREYTLKVNGDQVTATLGDETLKGTLRGGKLELAGEHYAQEAGYKADFKISGVVEGEQIKGTAVWETYDLTFTATRMK